MSPSGQADYLAGMSPRERSISTRTGSRRRGRGPRAWVSTAQVNLSWTDNSSDKTSFEVQRKPAGGDWATIAMVVASNQTFADGSLGGGLHFGYRVRAIGAGGASDWSNEATVDVPTVAG